LTGEGNLAFKGEPMTHKLELIKLSASAMKTYEQCPRKYYFNYIQRAPKKHWDHFDLGNVCHKALEVFHQEYMKAKTEDKRTLAQIMGYAFSIARKDFPKMNDTMLSDAKSMLMDYLINVKENGMPDVKGVESSFNFNITDSIIIRGFVDRIDKMEDGRFKIVDYKTTKNERYLDEFQLLIYGLWLRKDHPDMTSFRGEYVLLRHGSKTKNYEFSMEDVDKVEKKIIAYADSIRNEDTWSPIPTGLCNWCDFKEICPAHKNSAW
jgi:RecB family exonuclease